MPIIDTINNISSNLREAYKKLEEKGADIPQYKNMQSLPTTIQSIKGGSGTISPEYVSFNSYQGTTLDLSWLRTDKVTSMEGMFQRCNSLTSLDLHNFDTSNVASTQCMFYDCNSLTNLDLSNFNTSKVVYMAEMFWNCTHLTSLDLHNFNTSNALDISYMFNQCTQLAFLDISSFDFTNVGKDSGIFDGVPNNCEILVKDETAKTWITSKFSNLTNVQIKGA